MRLPTWVGDTVMATPALRALGEGFPEAELVVEGRGFFGEIVAPLPYVGRFVADPGKGWRALRARVAMLRRERFDLAVLLPDSQRAALAPWIARVPRRVGFSRDLARRLLLTDALTPDRERGPDGRARWKPVSMVERYLQLSRHVGCPDRGRQMDVPVTDAARAVVDERLAAAGLAPGEPFVVVVPGASYGASKLWPAERFGEACARLRERHGLRLFIAPGPGEEEVARAVVAASGEGHVFEGPVLSLGQAAALMARARLALSNDTGPRQISVAFGVPTVVPIGPSDPRYTEHDLQRQRVLRVEGLDCSPCGLKTCPIDHRCMTRLDTERVVAAAEELLAAFPVSASPLA